MRCWSEAGCDGLRERGVGRRVCEGVSWEGGGIWLWCEWERGLKEGLWENWGGRSGCGARDEKW